MKLVDKDKIAAEIEKRIKYDKAIPNPTHQMAMKWLREVHTIHIGINPIS